MGGGRQCGCRSDHGETGPATRPAGSVRAAVPLGLPSDMRDRKTRRPAPFTDCDHWVRHLTVTPLAGWGMPRGFADTAHRAHVECL